MFQLGIGPTQEGLVQDDVGATYSAMWDVWPFVGRSDHRIRLAGADDRGKEALQVRWVGLVDSTKRLRTGEVAAGSLGVCYDSI